eukprot:SAG11_NODE_309_length_10941_cov_5.580520_6_plen_370_part_00
MSQPINLWDKIGALFDEHEEKLADRHSSTLASENSRVIGAPKVQGANEVAEVMRPPAGSSSQLTNAAEEMEAWTPGPYDKLLTAIGTCNTGDWPAISKIVVSSCSGCTAKRSTVAAIILHQSIRWGKQFATSCLGANVTAGTIDPRLQNLPAALYPARAVVVSATLSLTVWQCSWIHTNARTQTLSAACRCVAFDGSRLAMAAFNFASCILQRRKQFNECIKVPLVNSPRISPRCISSRQVSSASSNKGSFGAAPVRKVIHVGPNPGKVSSLHVCCIWSSDACRRTLVVITNVNLTERRLSLRLHIFVFMCFPTRLQKYLKPEPLAKLVATKAKTCGLKHEWFLADRSDGGVGTALIHIIPQHCTAPQH